MSMNGDTWNCLAQLCRNTGCRRRPRRPESDSCAARRMCCSPRTASRCSRPSARWQKNTLSGLNTVPSTRGMHSTRIAPPSAPGRRAQVQPRPACATGRARPVAMVAVAKIHQVEAVEREQPQPPRQHRQFVQIQQQPDQAVAQPMPDRPEPRVHDLAVIERRHRHAAGSTISGAASATWMRPDSFGTMPRPPHAAELLRDREARLQAVLVEARAEPGAAEPGAAHALQRPQSRCALRRRRVEQRMRVGLGVQDAAGSGGRGGFSVTNSGCGGVAAPAAGSSSRSPTALRPHRSPR